MYNFADSEISRTTQIKNRLRVHRNKLQFELEPTPIISTLSKSKAFRKRSLDPVCASKSCIEKLNGVLSTIEAGSTEVVESFMAALKDIGYRDILDLLDPPEVHTKAGNNAFIAFFSFNFTGLGLKYITKTPFAS